MLPVSCLGADVRLANGIRLHYETSGSGAIPVVLVHGYGMSSAVWEKTLPLLPSGYRWLAVDLRGFGRSDKPEGGYGCPELAEDIAAFLDALGISRAVLIGHSFGGLVIQHFAARHPERVLAFVLSNTFSAALPPRGLTPVVEQRINGYGTAESNRKVFDAAVPRYFDASNVTAADIERFVTIGLQACTPALRETLRANYTTPAIPAPQLAAVRAPIIILVSAHDPFGTFDQAVAMSDALPDSRIRVFTRCGHTPMWEKPQEFAGTVADFLKTAGLR
ncbi:MAG: alpha/beta hydrolase [Chlamydiota bacterium]